MKNLVIGILSIFLLNSCATVFGGSKYNAKVKVLNHSDAYIYYKKAKLGTGFATKKIYRSDADKISFTVVKDGCKPEMFSFHKKVFRGGAFAGSLISSLITRLTLTDGNGAITSYPFPIQIIIDLANYPSMFKPDQREKGINKININNYQYSLDYKAILINPIKEQAVIETTSQKTELQIQEGKLIDLKRMYDQEIIDEQEYKLMKRKILGIEDIVIEEPIIDSTKIKTEPIKEVEVVKTPIQKVDTEIVEEKKSTDKEIVKEVEINDAKKEKISDLNKMLELEMITQEEYEEMKKMIIEQD